MKRSETECFHMAKWNVIGIERFDLVYCTRVIVQYITVKILLQPIDGIF